jgi:hypothetical protein
VTNFQILAEIVLGSLVLWELITWARGPWPQRFRLLRLLIWSAAALAIAFPGAVQQLAGFLGIGRGADVVLYLFVLVFLGTSFFLYARCRRLEQRLTLLVRHIALREAIEGNGPATPAEVAGGQTR